LGFFLSFPPGKKKYGLSTWDVLICQTALLKRGTYQISNYLHLVSVQDPTTSTIEDLGMRSALEGGICRRQKIIRQIKTCHVKNQYFLFRQVMLRHVLN